jgi:hypothetical protein
MEDDMQTVQGAYGLQSTRGLRIGIGRRSLVLAMVEREAAPRGTDTPRSDRAARSYEHTEHARRVAALGREQDRAAARAMGWWYGLYGTTTGMGLGR